MPVDWSPRIAPNILAMTHTVATPARAANGSASDGATPLWRTSASPTSPNIMQKALMADDTELGRVLQNLFEKYLPYAMVFGVVEKWAKAFEGLDDVPGQTSYGRTSGWWVSSPVD